MEKQIKQKGLIIVISSIILIAINVAQIFLPFFEFVGTIEKTGAVSEILKVRVSLFDIISDNTVEVISSYIGNSNTTINVSSLWPSSNDYSGACIMITIVGINLFFSLVLIALSLITKSTNKRHTTYFNSAWIVFVAISSMICMFGFGTKEVFPNVNFSGFECQFPVVWVILIAVINIVIVDFIINVQIEKVQKLAIENFVNKFKSQPPKMRLTILEALQHCILNARWASITEILNDFLDGQEKIHSKVKDESELE